MDNLSYGVVGRDGGFIYISDTLRGAKNYATRNGYTEVYCMHAVSWAVWKVSEKVNNNWNNV